MSYEGMEKMSYEGENLSYEGEFLHTVIKNYRTIRVTEELLEL